MRYSLEGPGKRLRPMLLFAGSEYLGLKSEQVLPAACAIEYVHTYSLIHDDLPAMDDDDMRRGKPSNHKKFGQAVAILSGDALLTAAFGQMLLLKKDFSSDAVLNAIEQLSHFAGAGGMVGGQLLDITTKPSTLTPLDLEFIHIHKTGALILASVLIPTKLAGSSQQEIDLLCKYGEAVGLAFQMTDDLLDTEAQIREETGARKKPKLSYPQLIGPGDTRDRINDLTDIAVEAFADKGEKAAPLIEIAKFIRNRKH